MAGTRRYWSPSEPVERLEQDERNRMIEEIRAKIKSNHLTYTWLICQLNARDFATDKFELSATLASTRLGTKADAIIRESVDILQGFEQLIGARV